MRKELIYLNGRDVDARRACVSVFDRGIAYGDGLFETMRAMDGRVPLIKEHLRRLVQGARCLGLDTRLMAPFIEDMRGGAIDRLLKKNRLDKGEAYVKAVVTRGVDRKSHLPAAGVPPTTIIVTKALDSEALSCLREKGVTAITVDDVLPALPGVKSLNYLASVLAKMRADKAGAFEAIFTRGHVAIEGSSSNLFIVKDGAVLTPVLARGLSAGALAGVTLGEIRRISKRRSIPFAEGPVTISAIESADEAFLTNSIIGVLPLVKLGRARIGTGRPGPVTRVFQGLMGRKTARRGSRHC